MTGSSDLTPLQARLPDTSTYPTTSLQVGMLAVVYLVSALAYITYFLRMYTRISSKQLGLDDWVMTAAMVFSIPLVSLQFFYYKYNYFGIPETEFKAKDPRLTGPPLLLTRWLNQVLYSPILGLVKASTLVLMLRIAGHMKDFRRAIYVINAINTALTISQFVGILFDRIPVAAYWDARISTQHKVDTAAFMTATSTITVLTDFLVLAVPFGVFVRTQLPRATRCGVILIFMTSGLVTIMGIIRLCVLVDAYYEPKVGGYMDSWGPCLNTVESSLGIMTGCLPTLSPLLREWFPRAFSNLRRGGTDQNGFSNQQSGGGGATSGKGKKKKAVVMSDFSHRHNPRSVSESTTESQQGFFKHSGIRKTTDIRVAYANRSLAGEHPGGIGSPGGAPSPALSDPALVHMWPEPRS